MSHATSVHRALAMGLATRSEPSYPATAADGEAQRTWDAPVEDF